MRIAPNFVADNWTGTHTRFEPRPCDLPNSIIIRIIREADGGRKDHKKNFTPVLRDITAAAEAIDKGEEYFGYTSNLTRGEMMLCMWRADNEYENYIGWADGDWGCLPKQQDRYYRKLP